MTQDVLSQIWSTLDATWPPVSSTASGPLIVRNGAGGGKRVSAAIQTGPVDADDVEAAAALMEEQGQAALFQVREIGNDFDALLEARGYSIVDPTLAYSVPAATLAALDLRRGRVIPCAEPLEVQREIWREGGIGPERLAVMERVVGAKTYLLGRAGDQPVGAAFVGAHGAVAMLHALEVAPSHRRQGVGRQLTIGAAQWALRQGATTLTLLVTRANLAANALYTSLGMSHVGGYHYRAAL